MPRYSSKKSYSGRRYRPYKRRSYGSTANRPVVLSRGFTRRSGITGFPSVVRTKLRYVENIALSSVLGAVSSFAMRANSLYDPNQTGTGHQPMDFDNYASIYGRYVVRGCKIKVTFAPVSEVAATSCWQIGIIGQKGTGVNADPQMNAEQGHQISAIQNGRTGGQSKTVLYLDFTPEKCLGITYKDTDAGALVSTNPDQVYNFVLWGADLQSTGTTNLVATIEMLFDVEFSQKTFVGGS